MAGPDPKPTRQKLSKTPSWIMLGFVIGCLFTFELQRQTKNSQNAAPLPPAAVAPPTHVPPAPVRSAAALQGRASLTAIEDVFAEYQSHAVWRHDITEVALWNNETNTYAEFFEVLRSGDAYYFRTIPHLTRPVIKPNRTPDAPLRFTEPEDVQLKRLKETSSIWLPPSTEP